MIARVVKNFTDRVTRAVVASGALVELTQERFDELVKNGFVEACQLDSNNTDNSAEIEKLKSERDKALEDLKTANARIEELESQLKKANNLITDWGGEESSVYDDDKIADIDSIEKPKPAPKQNTPKPKGKNGDK